MILQFASPNEKALFWIAELWSRIVVQILLRHPVLRFFNLSTVLSKRVKKRFLGSSSLRNVLWLSQLFCHTLSIQKIYLVRFGETKRGFLKGTDGRKTYGFVLHSKTILRILQDGFYHIKRWIKIHSEDFGKNPVFSEFPVQESATTSVPRVNLKIF